MTPLPTSVISSSPAWDPSSRTPIATPELDSRPSNELVHHSVTQHPCIQHPLLDPRLVGKKLTVVATGASFQGKEITVDIVLVGNQLSIRYTHYRTSQSLSPELVSAKHPNPLRDNGLLVVIQGAHCGKYVRRI